MATSLVPSITQNDLMGLFSNTGTGSMSSSAVTEDPGYQLPFNQSTDAPPVVSAQPGAFTGGGSTTPSQISHNDLLSLFSGNTPQNQVQPDPTPVTQQTNYDPATIKGYIAAQAAQAFGPDQVDPFLKIVNQESGFNPTAANSTSSARGLFQFLNTTAPSYGLPADASTASVEDQVAAGIKYVAARYGNPTNAWQFHLENNWY